jgi:putative Mg2+ transporter-C (MgtC) family protein
MMVWTDFTLRLIGAFTLGSVIGLERQWRQRMAGLRTTTLVSTGASLFVMLSVLTPGDASPTRIAAQIVSGIGFLCGGVILREGVSIRGLNTAATIWCAAAIGSLSGSGLLSYAAIGTVAVLMANILLRPIGHSFTQKPIKGSDVEFYYRFSVVCLGKHETHVRALLLQSVNGGKMQLRSLNSSDLGIINRVELNADLLSLDQDDIFLEQIINRLSLDSKVCAASWSIIDDVYS